jgi:hypothetical protein
MNCSRLIGRLLAVFVIAGLAVAPLATPATAKNLPAVSMSDMSAASGDMACCPDEQNKNDCPDCPLVAVCALKSAQAQPSSASGIVAQLPARKLFSAIDDTIADSLGSAPPDYPPRTLV